MNETQIDYAAVHARWGHWRCKPDREPEAAGTREKGPTEEPHQPLKPRIDTERVYARWGHWRPEGA